MENWTPWIYGLGIVVVTVFFAWVRDRYVDNLHAIFSAFEESREAERASRFYIEALRLLHELTLLVALIGLTLLFALILILFEVKGL